MLGRRGCRLSQISDPSLGLYPPVTTTLAARGLWARGEGMPVMKGRDFVQQIDDKESRARGGKMFVGCVLFCRVVLQVLQMRGENQGRSVGALWCGEKNSILSSCQY